MLFSELFYFEGTVINYQFPIKYSSTTYIFYYTTFRIVTNFPLFIKKCLNLKRNNNAQAYRKSLTRDDRPGRAGTIEDPKTGKV